ncbi:hypothetical protein CRE_03065 [Caenorhabditis remanei]|uniref:Uncharacterized protein n=1 Tax=Caenorhabditis remanei TaxID=31234 RepID=E3LWD5_CAERE|nr:hypothetical protein CRE_03065 [Caenorhabditis remanei]
MKFTLSLLLLTLLHSKPSAGQAPPPPSSSAAPPTVYHSVYVPVGVGEPQTNRKEFKQFGLFPSEFTKCGGSTLKLNEAFPQGNTHNAEILVDCEPSPTRVLIGKDMILDDFKRDLKTECELFACTDTDYEDKGADLKAIGNSVTGSDVPKAPEKEKKDINVCEAKKAGYMKNSATQVIFANEGNCFNAITGLEKKIKGITKDIPHQVPRWLKADKDLYNLRNFYFSDEVCSGLSTHPYITKQFQKSENLERVPYIFTHQPTQNPTYLACGTTCDRGKVVKLTMRPAGYSTMIYVDSKKCSSFRICYAAVDFLDDTKTPTCKDDFTIDVLFKNGVVIWGKKGRSSTIEFMSQYHQEAYTVAIEFGYGVKVHGNTVGNFYLGNDHREIVTSDSGGYAASEASQLSFIFPDENCLKEGAGIFSKNIETGKTFTTQAGKVESKGTKYNDKGEAISGTPAETATTTTKEPVQNLVFTTTPAAVRIMAEPGALSMIEENEAASKALFVAGKWWTWGIYAGFVIGTLVTLAIGGGLFYLLRRTVFGVWYRGMYKRYGCDASGTTGGITGVGFGNTTAAVETVAGTTGGTTVGTSTVGTTGGGDTTGSTSGSSTIAM